MRGPPRAFNPFRIWSAFALTSSYLDKSQYQLMWSISICVNSGLIFAANPTVGAAPGSSATCSSAIFLDATTDSSARWQEKSIALPPRAVSHGENVREAPEGLKAIDS